MTATNIVSWSSGAIRVIEVWGDLDLEAAPALARRAARDLAADGVNLVLDLREVEHLDSTGLAVLLNLKRRLLRRRARLRLVCGPPALRALEVARLTEEFPLYPSVHAAVGDGGTGAHGGRGNPGRSDDGRARARR